MMNSLFYDNPFARQHLKEVSLLSGEDHKNTLKDIKRILNLSKNKNNCRSILINGDRGTGKTSMIKLVEIDAGNYNCISVPYFLSDIYQNRTIDFFYELYSLLFKRCKQSDVLIEEIVSTETAIAKGELPEDQRKWVFGFMQKYLEYKIHSDRPINLMAEDISADLELIINQFRRKKDYGAHAKITIIIDEAQRIFDNSKILNIIRHIIQEEIGVTFILASQLIHDDTVIRHVFDRLDRAFKIFELKHFSSDQDVKEYIERSLKSVDWKERDFRLNIKKFDTLVSGIYHLTNGKPEFINGILERMFDRVQNGIDRKLRLNDEVLLEIADHIESSSTESKDYNIGFSLSRAKYIVGLTGDRLKWFRFLSKSLYRSTPNEVYKFMNPFTYHEISTEEQFHNFVHELNSKEILFPIHEKNKVDELGFKIARSESKSPFDAPFAYLGNNSEKVWTNLMLGLRKSSIMYGFQHPAESLIQEVMFIVGFHGKRTLSVKSKSPFVLNGDGVCYEESQKWDMLGFIQGLKEGSVNLEDFDIQLVRYLFYMFKSNKFSLYLCAVNIKFSDMSLTRIAYQEEAFSESRLEDLSKIVDRVNNESRNMRFELSEIKPSTLLSIEDFSNIIRSSDNLGAKRIIYIESVKPAVDLYMDDPQSNKQDILQWLDCVYEGIVAGDDITFEVLNNTGYMYLNLSENKKALTCLDRAYTEFKKRNINDPDLDNFTAILAIYNYAIIKFLLEDFEESSDLFNEVIAVSEMDSESDISALNVLIKNDQGKIILSEIKEDNIDIVELALSNLDLLNGTDVD